jgi:mycofactocin precursor
MPYPDDYSDLLDPTCRAPDDERQLMEPNQLAPNQQTDRDAEAALPATSDTELVTEILVEEVSIDGMCGVY